MEDISRGIAVVKLLKHIMGKIKSMFRPCGDLNLTGPQGMLVGTIAHYGAMKISDLSEKLGLSNSTVSGIVDRLERQGMVERIRSTDDRRVVWVSITSEHKAYVDGKFEAVEQKIEDAMNAATDDEIRKVFEGLEILKRLIEKTT